MEARMRACAGGSARPGYGRSGTYSSSLSPSSAERTVHLPGRVPLRQIVALIVGVLASSDAQLDLCPAATEVQRQRDDSEATLGRLTGEPVDFFAVQQQLTRTARLMVGPCPTLVLRDMQTM